MTDQMSIPTLPTFEFEGVNYQLDEDNAADYNSRATQLLAELENLEGDIITSDSRAADLIDQLELELQQDTVNFNNRSIEGNAETHTILNSLQNIFEGLDFDVGRDEASADYAASVAGFIKNFTDAALGEYRPEGDETGVGTDVGDGEPTQENAALESIKEKLDDVETASSSREKAEVLSDAIQDLIAYISDTGEGGAPEDGGSGVPPTDPGEEITDGEVTGGEGDDGEVGSDSDDPIVDEAPPPPAEPQTEIVTETYRGDDLLGKMNAGGAALTYELRGDDDQGVGVEGGEDDEVDGDEVLSFFAGETVKGGEVVVEDLFADKGGKGQEVATIEVMKDGEVVDTITVFGDQDGQQAVRIDQEFDQLNFVVDKEAGDARGSFSVSQVSVDREEVVEGGAVDPGTGVDGETPTSDTYELDAAVLMQLLQLLQALNERIDASDFSENMQMALIDEVSDVIESMVAAMEDDGKVTIDEVSGMLGDLRGIGEAVADAVDTDVAAGGDRAALETDATQMLRAVTSATARIVQEMDNASTEG